MASLGGFDSLLQAPARLQILAVLARVDEAEFARLREITGTSDSVMSKNLAALAECAYIKVRKVSAGGRQRTWATLTRKGRRAFAAHVAALMRIVEVSGSTAA
jgi:DNA-binding MarR family transcriptional regulator